MITALFRSGAVHTRRGVQRAPKRLVFIAPTGQNVGGTPTGEDRLGLKIGPGGDVATRMAVGAKFCDSEMIELAGCLKPLTQVANSRLTATWSVRSEGAGDVQIKMTAGKIVAMYATCERLVVLRKVASLGRFDASSSTRR